ncbi:unnamed protein product, partial [Coccothraustes coccothraustes]
QPHAGSCRTLPEPAPCWRCSLGADPELPARGCHCTSSQLSASSSASPEPWLP